jgi:hypothetical protein
VNAKSSVRRVVAALDSAAPIGSMLQLTTFPNRGDGAFVEVEVLGWLVFPEFMPQIWRIRLKP